MASSVDAKLLKSTKFPTEFTQKVDMKKVNVEVMKKWIAGKISEILGNEDDVVIELCFNLLEGSRFPDIKVLQIQLTGFLDKDTAKFCKDLWLLCLSAQGNPQGVPKELLEAKKLELIQEKIVAEKAAEESQRRKEDESQRERNIDSFRQRERGERGGRGRGRGDRDNYDHERRLVRRSRSPPPRRRSPPRDEFRPAFRREVDTYIPASGRRRHSPPPRRSRSLSSRSRTPPRRRFGDDKVPSSRRPRSKSRASVPRPLRNSKEDEFGRSSRRGDSRDRSLTPSDTSRSRSPRPSRRRRSPSYSSRSPSPPPRPRYTRRKRDSYPPPSRSRSRSLNRDRRRRSRRRSPPLAYDNHNSGSRADYRKERRRSPAYPSRRPSLAIGSRSKQDRLTPPPASRSRSRGVRVRRPEKRRRSTERYAPPSRRRNTSSVSSPDDKRRKMADSSADEGSKPDQRKGSITPPIYGAGTTAIREPNKISSRTGTELRERLLKEKLQAMRNGNPGTAMESGTNAALSPEPKTL